MIKGEVYTYTVRELVESLQDITVWNGDVVKLEANPEQGTVIITITRADSDY
jgi:hypothetical protein